MSKRNILIDSPEPVHLSAQMENVSHSFLSPALVTVPSGKFLMGSVSGASRWRDECPQHEVSISSFLLSFCTITQRQWQSVAVMLPQINIPLSADPSHFKGGNRPVECVSWLEAVEFCNRLSVYDGRNYRLPTEAEWEYACRAGTNSAFYFGESLTVYQANFRDSRYSGRSRASGSTVDVASFPPNAFGLHDMHGNVAEWCLDSWHHGYQGAPVDGRAWVTHGASRRVVRGGSWLYPAHASRSAHRGYLEYSAQYINVGFRIVCDTW